MNRRAFLLGATGIAVVAAVVASIPAQAQALSKMEQIVYQTITNYKARMFLSNPTIAKFAANDNTIMNAVAADMAVSSGSTWLRWAGRATGAVGLGLVVLEIGKYVHATQDKVTVSSFMHYGGAVSTVADMRALLAANGPVEWGGYGYASGVGGSSTAFPVITSPGWAIWWIDTAHELPSGQWFYIAITTSQVTSMSEGDKANLLASLATQNPEEAGLTDPQLQTQLSPATNPIPYAQVAPEIAKALSPFADPDSPILPQDVPDDGLSPNELVQPVPVSPLSGSQSSSSSSASASSSSSSSSASSSSTAETGSLPGLPSVPEPPAWFHQWADNLNPVMPVIPSHDGSCPALVLPKIIAGSGNQLSYTTFNASWHCAIGEQMKPVLRTFAAVGASLSSLFIIMRS